MPLKVLYIHHCGTQGGSSRSMKEMIMAFPEKSVQPHIITPKGTAADYFEKANIPLIKTIGITQFDMTQLGYYRKIRWAILLRELFYVPFTIISIVKAKYKWKDIDVIHVNDVQSLFPLYIAKKIFNVPVVLHVRCPVLKKKGKRFHFLKRFVMKNVEMTLAIDETVKHSLPKGFDVEIVHNGLMMPKAKQSKKEITNRNRLTVGMVSNLFLFKGVLDFVEAANICKNKGYAIDFKIIGGRDVRKKGIKDILLKRLGFRNLVDEKIYDLIEEYKLTHCFSIDGFVQNLSDAYGKIDVLCFPSHINAVGRPVFEAGFFKVPSIVAIDKPFDDAIVHMETGICIREKSPKELANAIAYFYKKPEDIRRMGGNAYNLAHKNYDIYKNASKVLEIYNTIVENES